MMRSSYPGQGTKLPREMGPGVWVIENLLHLSFVGEEGVVPHPHDWDFDLGPLGVAPATNISMGFSAQRLSDALGVPFTELLDANRRGLLRVSMALMPEESSSTSNVRFQFLYGAHCSEVVSNLPAA